MFPRPDDPFAPGHRLFPSDQLGPLYDEADLENLWDELAHDVPASAYTYVFRARPRRSITSSSRAGWPASCGGCGSRT